MVVYFLRHASAGQRKSDPAKDEKRGLDRVGIEQCRNVGRALSALRVQVDVIVTSPLKRAAQTASMVANEMNHEGKLEITDALRPEAQFADFSKLLGKYARQEAVMVVGHNPNLSEFLGRVIGDGAEASIELKKGAIAKVEVRPTYAALQWCVTPKILRSIYETTGTRSRPKTSRK